jgi:hypothetical protein
MSEEDLGFKVRDRRRLNPDGTLREEVEESEEERPQREARSPEAEGKPREEARRRAPLPPVDFSGLIVSLAQAAMMHMGQLPDPKTGERRQDMELARHTIDTIAMLKEKTQGNLSEEEQRLLDHTLTDLRLAYVQLNK